MQAAPEGAKRCPNCGERLRTGERRVMLYLGIGGLVLLAALAALAWFSIPEEETQGPAAEAPATSAPAKKNPLD